MPSFSECAPHTARPASIIRFVVDRRVPGADGSQGQFWITDDGEAPASDVEIEFVEHAGSVGHQYAFVFKNDVSGRPTRNVSVHDCHFHDFVRGGVYLAAADSRIDGFAFYRNRVLRVHMCSDFAWIGPGTMVRQNVFALCGFDRLEGVSTRATGILVYPQTGDVRIEENLVFGTPGTALDVGDYTTPERAGPLRVANNVFAETGANWVEIGRNLPEGPTGLEIEFDRNRFRRRDTDARLSGTQAHSYVFWVHARETPVTIARTTWDDEYVIRDEDVPERGLVDPSLDEVTYVGLENAPGTLEPVVFQDFLPGGLEDEYVAIVRWNSEDRFAADAVVVHEGAVYRALRDTTTGEVPGEVADAWMLLGAAGDDVTLDPSSPYDGVGVR